MRYFLCILLIACLGGCLTLFASPAIIHNARYTVTDLGVLAVFPHSDWSQAAAVNDKGQVALNTRNGGQAYATVASVWDKGKTQRITDFPALAGSSMPGSEAFGLNNQGQVVGTYSTGVYTGVSPWTRAFIFEKGHMTLLDAPAGADLQAIGINRAFGINDAGQIVGSLDFHNGSRHPYLWTHQKPSELPTLGGKYSEARAINAAGVIVGMSSLPDEAQHAVRWEQGEIHDINPPGFKGSEATGINNKGQIVGSVLRADDSTHACIWTQGKVIDLGTLGGKHSMARGINDAGQVVGEAEIGTKVQGYNTVTHAFLWDAKNGLRDLNTLLPTNFRTELWDANGINNKGQIVADPLFSHALLLTPLRR